METIHELSFAKNKYKIKILKIVHCAAVLLSRLAAEIQA